VLSPCCHSPKGAAAFPTHPSPFHGAVSLQYKNLLCVEGLNCIGEEEKGQYIIHHTYLGDQYVDILEKMPIFMFPIWKNSKYPVHIYARNMNKYGMYTNV
jgi:hypothetical protein